ncbi:MAG TPA: long-chain fatty acid--CoA ligase [Polyangiales bacterium]|nr:long-chain fatty acid--CoA ligase [Polyangiales bacterium]
MTNTQQDFQPAFSNLVEMLESAVAQFGDKPLFGKLELPGDTIQWTSYREFADLVARLRSGLAKLGVQRGQAVAVIANNRLEWAVGAHATMSLGGHYVPMYEAQLEDDWEYILNDSESTVCFVANEAIAKRLVPLRERLPKLRHVVNFEGPAEDPGSYAGLLAYGASHPVPAIHPKADELGFLIYTSGTTGRPKGVMLNQATLGANVSSLLANVVLTNDDRGLAFLPWAHIFGGSVELNLTIVTGGSTVICPDGTQLAQYLPKVKPTILFAVPRVWNKIYDGVQKLMAGQPVFQAAMSARAKQRRGEQPTAAELEALAGAEQNIFPLIRGVFGGQLRYACSGAAALAREVAEFMDTLGIQVYEGYGLTETGGVTTAQPYGEIRLGSVGKALPGVRIELDPNVPGAGPGEGEVIVYGKGVMSGYYKKPEDSRVALTPEGGLRTGDIGRLDADGYLYITGRVKELYKLENGKYVAPAPLEETVTLSPYIQQCVVYGSNRPHNVALIVPDLVAVAAWAKQNGIEAEGEALLSEPRVQALLEGEIDRANDHFKGFERIQRFVIEIEELTPTNGMLTPTLKLKRRKFNERYEPVLESLYPPAAEAEAAPRVSYIRELQPTGAVKTGS